MQWINNNKVFLVSAILVPHVFSSAAAFCSYSKYYEVKINPFVSINYGA